MTDVFHKRTDGIIKLDKKRVDGNKAIHMKNTYETRKLVMSAKKSAIVQRQVIPGKPLEI